jgi:hypothetical protein
VIRRHVPSALAAGIAAGNDATRVAPCSMRYGPARGSRRPARGRARHRRAGSGPDEFRYLQRVAAIICAALRPRRSRAVAACTPIPPVLPPPRRWIATIAAAVTLAAAGGVARASGAPAQRATQQARRYRAGCRRSRTKPAARGSGGGRAATGELTNPVIAIDADRNAPPPCPDRWRAA